MRISVWSSDVCSFKLSSCQRSSDRQPAERSIRGGWARSAVFAQRRFQWRHTGWDRLLPGYATQRAALEFRPSLSVRDRKSVVSGKSVYVRVDLGGGRIIKNKKKRRE